MQKPKKITVKFFLHQKVEPVTGDKGEKYLPLYLQVTYDRRNMQFRSFYGEYYASLEEVPEALMSFERHIVEQIITFEAVDQDYDLKGLKHRFAVYSAALSQVVEQFIKPRLWRAIQQTNNKFIAVLEFRQPKSTVGLLYQAAKRLIDNFDEQLDETLKSDLIAYTDYMKLLPSRQVRFDFATLADWVGSSYPSKLDKQMRKVLDDKEKRDAVQRLITEATVEYLKQV